MDLSGFYGVFFVELVIYATIYLNSDRNAKTGVKVFYFVAVPVNLLMLYMSINIGLYQTMIGSIFATAIGYAVFRLQIISDKAYEIEIQLKEKQEIERVKNLSPQELKLEQKSKEEQKRIEREEYYIRMYGYKNSALVCPHCQTKGSVRSREGESEETYLNKKNLYRAKKITKMRCDNCNTEWQV